MSTYLETGVNVISSADLVSIEEKYVYHMSMTYKDFDELKRLSKKLQFSFENVTYEDKINVDVLIDNSMVEQLANYFPKASIEVMGNRKVYVR